MDRSWLAAFTLGAILAAQGAALSAQERAVAGGGVSVVSGGIGETARQQLLERESSYNLKLVFTLVEGNYLAGVDVTIVGAGGKPVAQHTTDGPFLLARLPPGSYTVRAVHDGRAQERKLKIGDRPRTEYLRWPADTAVDFALPPEHRRAD